MLDPIVGDLVCPHGESSLGWSDGGLVCPAGHRFDVARQGHVNLLTGPAPAAADTPAMVAARVAFQQAGHHDDLTDAIVETVAATADDDPGTIVDIGAGTGRHLAAVVERLDVPAGLAIDVSKHAAQRAARAHDRVGAVVADTWRGMPVRTGAADVILDVFAPRNVAEIHRLLRPGGILVVVTPTSRHLEPLVDRLGLLRVGGDKLERIDADLVDMARPVTRDEIERTLHLSHDDVTALASMGPSAHHLDRAALEDGVEELADPVDVTLSVTLSTYRRC